MSPPSMSGPCEVMPITPPHDRLPITGPNPACLKRAANMSPSEAEFSFSKHTRWPRNTSLG